MILGDGDFVVGRWTATGNHTGPWGAMEPTGRPIAFSGVNIFRFEGGKVAEIWNHRDDLGLMTQIGGAAFTPGPSPQEAPRRPTLIRRPPTAPHPRRAP